MKKKTEIKFFDWVVIFFQIIAYTVFRVLVLLFLRPTKKINFSTKKIHKGTLLIANHQSSLDPFIIIQALPFRVVKNLLPIKFPTKHEIIRKLPFLYLLGCYDIGHDKCHKMLGLLRTRQYIIDGYTLVIFPEGRVCHTEEFLEFNKGICFLTDVAKSTVFVRIRGFHKRNWLKFHNERPKLVFSEVFVSNFATEDINFFRRTMENL